MMHRNEFDQTDRELLDLVQREVPLVRNPFARIGECVGLDGKEVIRRLGRLRDSLGVIRQISGIFDSRRLGYRGCLVAALYPVRRIEDAAAIINGHPGVSHNYRRGGRFNLWYTIAVPPASKLGLTRTVELLAELTGAETTLILPALRVYKIGVRLDVARTHAPDWRDEAFEPPADHAQSSLATAMDAADMPVVRALQVDLPLEPDAFASLAEQAGLGQEQFLAAAGRLLASGHMRRFAAVLRHERAGFTTNVLTAWRVLPDQVDRLGPILASFAAVSHCYLRPTYPQWPHNILAMVHARSGDELVKVVDAMVGATGLARPAELETVEQYKKSRLQYCVDDVEIWEARHA